MFACNGRRNMRYCQVPTLMQTHPDACTHCTSCGSPASESTSKDEVIQVITNPLLRVHRGHQQLQVSKSHAVSAAATRPTTRGILRQVIRHHLPGRPSGRIVQPPKAVPQFLPNFTRHRRITHLATPSRDECATATWPGMTSSPLLAPRNWPAAAMPNPVKSLGAGY